MVEEQKPVSKQIYIFRNTLYPLIKIGMSDNPAKRMSTIECASGFPLELAYESIPVIRPQITEKLIHKRLHQYRTKGEWFTLSVEDAITEIEQAVAESVTGEYKDLTKDFQLKGSCVEVIDHHFKIETTNTYMGYVDRFTKEEEYIYRDNYYNYYIQYIQGELKRTAKFCNFHLARKFRDMNYERLVIMQ